MSNVKNSFVIDKVDPNDPELLELKTLQKMKLDIRLKKKALKRKQFDATHPGIARLRDDIVKEYDAQNPVKEEPVPAVPEEKEIPTKTEKVAKEAKQEEATIPVYGVVKVGLGESWLKKLAGSRN